MNERSRRKRYFPKGLPFEAETVKNRKDRIVPGANTFPIDLVSAKCSSGFSRSVLKGPRLIRRAYTEPLGYNLVENILLQRNYIID